MKTSFKSVAISLIALVSIVGASHSTALGASPAVDEDKFLLAEEPEGGRDVIDVRQKSKDGEELVVIGRIGGRTMPWVKGAAAFSIVDASLKSCDQIPGDTCPTPWDYCCETDLNKATVLVTFVDEKGAIVKNDLRESLNLKELQTVAVKGKVKRDASGNVRLLASKMYVRDDKPSAVQ